MTTKKEVKGEYPKYISDAQGKQIMREGHPLVAQNEEEEKIDAKRTSLANDFVASIMGNQQQGQQPQQQPQQQSGGYSNLQELLANLKPYGR